MNKVSQWICSELKYVARNIQSELDSRAAKLVMLGITGLLFSTYLAIPVHFIPGNTLSYYLSIEPIWGFLLLAVLAVEISLLLTSRVVRTELEFTGNALADFSTAVFSLGPSILACPILATALLSFLLPATTIYSLTGMKWEMVGMFVFVAAGANYWKYSGCARCQQWN